jgi:putative Holliday junction resolvase
MTQGMGGAVLAFDFGGKRIGVAIADTALAIAHPLPAIHAEANAARFAAIAALIAEWKPAQLVVGEPRHADGGEHEVARLARKFAQRLHGRFNLPVALVDEALSSAAAAEKLRAGGGDPHDRDGALDSLAAAEILQTWLDIARKKTVQMS